MHQSITNLNIQTSIKSNQEKTTKIISKLLLFQKHLNSHINPLIDYGHTDFGENKVQEAIEKWTDIKNKNNKILLHLVGKLQSNRQNWR